MHALTLTNLQLQACKLMKIASSFISMQFHASPKTPAMDYNSFCQIPHKAHITTSPVSVTHTVSPDQSLATELHKVPSAFNLGILSRISVPAFQNSNFACERRFQWPPDSAELFFHHLPLSRHTYKMLPIKMSHFVKWYLHIFSII